MAKLGSGSKLDVTEAYTVPAQINGRDVYFDSSFDVVSPATGEFLHHCTSASVADALEAVAAAHAAFPKWRDTLPNVKRDVFLKVAALMEGKSDELATIMTDETGSDEFWGKKMNVPLSVDILKDVAGRIATLGGIVPVTGVKGTSSIIYKEPFGAILAIAPWNAPFILGIRSIAFALAAGNTAVLKAPELSPKCFYAIGDLFREAGLPDGVLNVIAHKPADAAAVTKALIDDVRIKKVNFTGSTTVGRVIAELAGKNLKPVLLELGGKAPAIVWKDANLKNAAEKCVLGSFLHSGQICMSTERIIVHKDVQQEFELLLQSFASAMFGEAGVLISKAGVEKNKRLVRDAIAKGATLLHGSVDTQESSETRMSPVIIKYVTPGMDIYQQESFGPTVSLIIVDSEEEALRVANDTEYGLSAAVFTEDLRTGLRFAKGIESGAVHINDMTVHDETALPHGGMKSSGFGRFGSIGLDEWVRTKTVTFKD